MYRKTPCSWETMATTAAAAVRRMLAQESRTECIADGWKTYTCAIHLFCFMHRRRRWIVCVSVCVSEWVRLRSPCLLRALRRVCKVKRAVIKNTFANYHSYIVPSFSLSLSRPLYLMLRVCAECRHRHKMLTHVVMLVWKRVHHLTHVVFF